MKFEVPDDDKPSGNRGLIRAGKQFSSEYQPPNEALRRGWKKKLRNQELTAAMLQLPYVGPRDEGLKQTLANYFGIQDDDEISNEMMIIGLRIGAAIQKLDFASAQWLLDRAYGKAMENIQFSNTEESKQIIIQPVIMSDGPELKTSTNEPIGNDPANNGLVEPT